MTQLEERLLYIYQLAKDVTRLTKRIKRINERKLRQIERTI